MPCRHFLFVGNYFLGVWRCYLCRKTLEFNMKLKRDGQFQFHCSAFPYLLGFWVQARIVTHGGILFKLTLLYLTKLINTTILNVQGLKWADTSMSYKRIRKNVARTIDNIKFFPQILWIGGFKKDSCDYIGTTKQNKSYLIWYSTSHQYSKHLKLAVLMTKTKI